MTKYYTQSGEVIRNPDAYARTGAPMYTKRYTESKNINAPTTIYKMNLKGGKKYVGKTTDVDRRELDLDESSTEFEYEGVTYYKKKSNGKWIVEDKSEDGEVVGHMSSDGESLIWTDECYEEMHKDHDDYNGEESD